MGGKLKKKTSAKTGALDSAVFRKKMAIEWQKKVYKKSPAIAREHCLRCHIKIATKKTTLKKLLNDMQLETVKPAEQKSYANPNIHTSFISSRFTDLCFLCDFRDNVHSLGTRFLSFYSNSSLQRVHGRFALQSGWEWSQPSVLANKPRVHV